MRKKEPGFFVDVAVSLRNAFIWLILLLLVLAFGGQAHAYMYVGGDWDGADFILSDGDILAGTFTNVGLFRINAGDTVYVNSDSLGLSTSSVLINGTLAGNNALNSELNVSASSDITLGVGGILHQWHSISLIAEENIALLAESEINLIGTSQNTGSIIVSSGSAILASDTALLSINGTEINSSQLTGGTIEVSPAPDLTFPSVPIPATALLFLSGLPLVILGKGHKTH